MPLNLSFPAVHWVANVGDSRGWHLLVNGAITSTTYHGVHFDVDLYSGVVTVTGTPTMEHPTSAQLIAVVNGTSASGLVSFNIAASTGTVLPIYPGPFEGVVGQPFLFLTTITPNAVTAWHADGLPPGLDIDGQGAISGHPTTEGTFVVHVYGSASTQAGDDANATADGTVTIVIYASGQVVSTDSHVGLSLDVGTGALTCTDGAALAYFGDQKVIHVTCVPTGNAGNVSNVRFTFKEKSEVRQYAKLLEGTAAPSGPAHFTFPATLFAGDLLRDSLLLYDEVEPSVSVVYSLEAFFDWGGRTRKSSILDWTVLRPQDMDAAVEDTFPPPDPSSGGAAGLRVQSVDGTGGTMRLAWRDEGNGRELVLLSDD